mgnify:CR=1 FL=1
MLSLNLSNEQKEQIYILEFCFGEPEQNKTIFILMILNLCLSLVLQYTGKS